MLGIRDGIALPSDKEKELSDIKSGDGYFKSINFPLPRKIFGAERIFKRIKKRSVNSRGDGLPPRLGNMWERYLGGGGVRSKEWTESASLIPMTISFLPTICLMRGKSFCAASRKRRTYKRLSITL